MFLWKKKLNNYGLSDTAIIILFAISMVSIVAEIVSIGIFIPLFELINQHGAAGLSNSDSNLIQYIHNFVSFIGLDMTIEILLILSFSLFVFSKVLLYILTYIQAYYRGFMTKNMKNTLLHKYLHVDSLYYDIVGIGDFVNSSSVELSSAVSGVMVPIKLIITVISAVFSFVFLFIISPKLTFISVCIVSIGVLLPVRWVKATTKIGKKTTRSNSVVNSFLLNRLQSPRLVRLSNTAKAEEEDYSVLTEKQRRLILTIQLLKARITLILEPVIIGISLLMFYTALVILKIPFSEILVYMIIMIKAVPIATNILSLKQSINRAVGSMQAIEKLLSDMSINTYNYAKKYFNKINKVSELRLEGVYFRYNSYADYALSNISHVFKKSTLVVIVGPSGSGKTTFVDIVSGYRKPTSGNVFVAGINTDRCNPEVLMSLISYVPQTSQIFDGATVYEHIAYGRPNSTLDEVINASKLSGAYNFIKELPQGFDTVLVGISSSLSGGQRQRLDLSRALLRDTPLLIMDEPTGSLDLISEKELMLKINKIREITGKIVIIITHRVHAIMDADQIIVLEDGEISGIGTNAELLVNNSWYKKAVEEL